MEEGEIEEVSAVTTEVFDFIPCYETDLLFNPEVVHAFVDVHDTSDTREKISSSITNKATQATIVTVGSSMSLLQCNASGNDNLANASGGRP